MEIMAGQIAKFQRRFSQKDFDRFAALIRDHNPIHVDAEFSRRTRFGGTVAHGMLLYGMISRGFNTLVPGKGILQIKQEMMFRYPTYTQTDISVEIEVLQIDAENRQARLKTAIHLPDGNFACDGNALISLTEDKQAFPGIDKTLMDPVVPGSRTLKHLRIGQSAKVSRRFTGKDLEEYSDLTGDSNPYFTDPGYAVHRGFQNRLIPPPLISGMFSDLLGTRLPGTGTNWLKQNLYFPSPAYVDEEITARVEITRLRPEKNLVNLAGTCSNAAGEWVCQAQSLVLVKDLEVSK
jgi:acyl dehydratase